MREVLGLDHVALTPDSPTLSMSVGAGQTVAVIAPSGEGKTSFLRVLAGEDRPAEGSVSRRGEPFLAEAGALSRRVRPIGLARSGGGPNVAGVATEALMTTRLWEVRDTPVGDLSPGRVAAAEIVGALVSEAEILLIDGQLDRLDPWTLASVLGHLGKLRAAGAAVVIATARPELLRLVDAIVVLRERQVRFAGTLDDLLRTGPPHTLTVATENQPGVRALVSPFSVSVQETPEGLRFEASEGQELAARLLLEGYGDVQFVVDRAPTVEEALLGL